MYSLITFIEKIIKFIRIKIMVFYWKLKYGKRIEIGKNFRFRKNLKINITNKGFLKIGNNNFFNNDCSINCHKQIIIGDNNLFGENVKMYDHNHVFNNKNIDVAHTFYEHEVIIGNNNWIASDVTFLSKAKINDYNVIGTKVIVNQEYDNENLIQCGYDNSVKKINYIGE